MAKKTSKKIKKVFNKILKYKWFILVILFVISGLATYKIVAAPTWPDGCGWSCNANDVTVTKVWLGDASGTELTSSCVPDSTVSAYIWAEFNNGTGTDRYTVVLFGDVNKNGSFFEKIDVCTTPDTMPTGLSTRMLIPFSWICGDEIDISNMTVAWQTSSNAKTSCANDFGNCNAFPNAQCFRPATNIHVAAPLVADFTTNSPVCLGEAINFSGTATGGTSPYTYSWTFGPIGATGTGQNTSYTYSSAGIFSTTLTVNDNASDTDTQNHDVTVLALSDPTCGGCTTNADCNNDVYCDGSEICDAGICKAGTAIDCSVNSFSGIDSCTNIPDGINSTWDFRNAFGSICDENAGSCTTGDNTINHTCSGSKCSAECDAQNPCLNTICSDKNGCQGRDYYTYTDVSNTCDSTNCTCTKISCGDPQITVNDPSCGDCSTDSDCASLNKDYCDDSTPKHDVGKCVDLRCTAQTTTGQDCNNGLACDGTESCSQGTCQSGTTVDCRFFNRPLIATCVSGDDPLDTNPLTWDYRDVFTSQCQEPTGMCTSVVCNPTTHVCVPPIIHTCNKTQCGGCEVDADCNDDNSSTADSCNITTCACSNIEIPPTQGALTIIKEVIGGSLLAGDFHLFIGTMEVTTGASNILDPGTYTVSETSVMNYTGAITGDCGVDGLITLVAGDNKSCTITNTFQESPRPSCGNGVVETGEICDNATQNGVECTPGCSSTCSYCTAQCTSATKEGSSCGGGGGGGGTPSYPVITITETVDPTSANAGVTVNYTITVKNIGTDTANNVGVDDTLPSGFTYADTGLTTKHWDLGSMAPGVSQVLNFQAVIAANVTNGDYDSPSNAKGTNTNLAVADASVTVVGAVLGASTEELPTTGGEDIALLLVSSMILSFGSAVGLKKNLFRK